MTHGPEKYFVFNVIYYGWNTTATNLHPHSPNNSISVSGKINEIHKITLKRRSLLEVMK